MSIVKLVWSVVLLSGAAQADVVQEFSAKIGGAVFESGDEEITLIPIGSSFNLNASTRGAAAWPPPQTPIHRLSIVCDGFQENRPIVLGAEIWSRSTCDVTYAIGVKPMGGDPDQTYTLDKSHDGNRFEITRAEAKVYTGRFSFRLRDAAGGVLDVVDGQFLAQDRQL